MNKTQFSIIAVGLWVGGFLIGWGVHGIVMTCQ